MTDIILESVRAVVLLMIVAFLYRAGRGRFDQFQKGWTLIIFGFGLLLFGSLLDISDNFAFLNPLVVVGDTEVEAFLEKFVGFLGGFVLLAIGLWLWIPGVQGMSDLVEERTRDLQDTNDKLVTEITERKRAERVKQEFTATVNHELRTPLTSIKGALGLIRSDTIGPLSEQTQALLDIAYRNSDRLEALINDLLDVERIEAAETTFQSIPVDLAALIDETIEINKDCGERYGVTYSHEKRTEEAWVQGDPDRLRQVLSNLLSNAAKFSASGEMVNILLTRDRDTVQVAVHNEGAGIPQTAGDDIFEKFSQLDTADDRKSGGTGLGLSIAKAIVEKHNGTIGYDSNIGAGATFFFTLPCLER